MTADDIEAKPVATQLASPIVLAASTLPVVEVDIAVQSSEEQHTVLENTKMEMVKKERNQ